MVDQGRRYKYLVNEEIVGMVEEEEIKKCRWSSRAIARIETTM